METWKQCPWCYKVNTHHPMCDTRTERVVGLRTLIDDVKELGKALDVLTGHPTNASMVAKAASITLADMLAAIEDFRDNSEMAYPAPTGSIDKHGIITG